MRPLLHASVKAGHAAAAQRTACRSTAHWGAGARSGAGQRVASFFMMCLLESSRADTPTPRQGASPAC